MTGPLDLILPLYRPTVTA